MAGTLEMGDLIIRFHSALREIVHFDQMLLVLQDSTEGMSQAFAFSGSGARGEVTDLRLEDSESRPEGLYFNDDGTATYTRDFTAGEAANMRLRLDFETETLPSNHKMVLLETVCQQAGTALSLLPPVVAPSDRLPEPWEAKVWVPARYRGQALTVLTEMRGG